MSPWWAARMATFLILAAFMLHFLHRAWRYAMARERGERSAADLEADSRWVVRRGFTLAALLLVWSVVGLFIPRW